MIHVLRAPTRWLQWPVSASRQATAQQVPAVIEISADRSNILSADFSPAALARHTGQLNSEMNNTTYLHTFVWNPESPYSKVTRAILLVRMKALAPGISNCSESRKDIIAVTGKDGIPVTPYDERVYPPGDRPAGTLATRAWDIKGAALDRINTNHTLSFMAGPDTSVLYATLTLYVC